jgi:hypothetical protein
MKKVLTPLALLLLLGGSAALAQSGNNSGMSGSSTGTGATRGGIPEAPIGHRQPRANDVPNEKNLSNPNDPMNKEDAALDRKIKSICRGC